MARSSLITELVLNDSFRSLDEATLASLGSELESVHLYSGEILFRQGDPGDSMFVLVRGTLAASLNTTEGKEIVVGNESEPGTTIGEMALVTGQERMVTVRVLNDAELIKLSKAGFNILAEKEPLVAAELAKITAGRWQQAQLAVALSNLLGDVNPAVLNQVQTNLEWRELDRGEVLFERGDQGDAMYIVVNGRLRITSLDQGGHEKILDEIGSGEIVGEFALFTGEPRTATVYAIRKTNLAKLSEPLFAHLVMEHPEAMLRITRKIISRHPSSMRISTMEALNSFNIALLPISKDVTLDEFSRQLAESLGSLAGL